MGAGSFAAIIPAAGLSSRMGCLKALLSFGEVTALERVIGLFVSCGVSDVRVVVGHAADRLAPILRSLGVASVFNPDHAQGMFTSVVAGVRSLDPEVDAFFFLPVDIPLVRPATIRRLLDGWTGDRNAVLHPTLDGRRGHPPLIGGAHIPGIAAWTGDGGLGGYLRNQPAREIPVPDRFMNMDLDTPEDYRTALAEWVRFSVPNAVECKALRNHVAHTPEPVQAHCLAVAEVAETLGRAVVDAGGHLDLPLLVAAARLHDIRRGEPNHAEAAAELLRRQGFPTVADLVARHMDLEPREGRPVNEAELLFLADKLVDGTRRVEPEARFEAKLARFRDDPDARAGVRRRMERALAAKARVERTTGRPIAAILREMRGGDVVDPVLRKR
jgi:molybdenum cofactor cytidylyltransferase